MLLKWEASDFWHVGNNRRSKLCYCLHSTINPRVAKDMRESAWAGFVVQFLYGDGVKVPKNVQVKLWYWIGLKLNYYL